MRLRVIDLETTGFEPPAEIIEFGFTDVMSETAGVSVGQPTAWLYRPLNGIPPETKAVHHLTESDFGPSTFPCTTKALHGAVWFGEPPDVLVAHNCAFERKFVPAAVTGTLPWICTYKVALHLWPEAPGHSNQILRYWRGLELDPALAMPPHRAGPDAWVSAHLLCEMLRLASVDQMIAWTNEPRPMPKIMFGKHKGTEWSAVPTDYLQWMSRQEDMDPDVLWHAGRELGRRG